MSAPARRTGRPLIALSTVWLTLVVAGCASDTQPAPFERFDATASTLTVNANSAPANGVNRITLTATAKDKAGNPLAGLSIRFAVSGTGNLVTQPTGLTDAQGVATGSVASTVAETKTLSAQVQNLGQLVSFVQTASVTFTPAGPSLLAFTVQPTDTGVGAAIAPAVQVTIQDSVGGTVTSATDAVTIALGANPNGATLSGTVTVNAIAGVATFSDLKLDKIGAGYTLTASATGLNGATSNAFATTAGSATRLAISTQPVDTVAGEALAPAIQVTIQDASGNTVAAAFPVTVTLGNNPGSGTLGGTTSVNAVAGVATFSDLTVDKAGAGYTLAFSAAGLTGATSAGFNVSPATAARLQVTVQPISASSTATITPAVKVAIQDGFGNTITGATNAVTVAIGTNPGGGTLGGTTTVNAVAGVATFSDLSIDKAGSGYKLAFSAGGLTGATSDGFNIVAGPAAAVAFVVQPGTTVAGEFFDPQVQVAIVDSQGNAVTTATTSVTVSLSGGTGTLFGTTTQSPTGGIATFSDLRVDKVGAGYALTASATGVTGATSNTFAINPGPARSLLVAGLANPTTAGTMGDLTVTAVDDFGNTATGYTGTVAFSSSDMQAVLPASYTFLSGEAGSHTFTAGVTLKTAGSRSVTVTDSTNAAITGTQNVVVEAAGPKALAFTEQPTSASAGVAIAPAVKVAVQDEFGNTVTSAVDMIAIDFGNNAGGGTLSGTKSRQAQMGVATFNDLSIDKAASGYTLAATSGSLTTATSTAFAIAPAAPTKLVFSTGPQSTTAGLTLAAVVVQVQDALGNVVTAATDLVSLVLSPTATLNGTATLAAAMGAATFSDLAVEKAGDYTLSASSGSLTPATSGSFTISAAAASKLLVTGPTSPVTAGVETTVNVTAQDPFGNTATSYLGTVAFTSTDTQATLPGSYTFLAGDNGTQSFPQGADKLILKSAGSQNVIATDSTTGSIAGLAQITVTPGPTSKLAFTVQPSDIDQNAAITPAVQVAAQDEFGNITPGYSDQVTVAIGTNPPGDGALTGTTMRTPTTGVATFDDLQIDKVGVGYTLRATSGALTPAVSATFNVLGVPQLGDLVITEVMHTPNAPTGNTDNGKWFEVRNLTAKPLMLSGLTVELVGGASFPTEQGLVVGANGHFVFGAAPQSENGGVAVDSVYPVGFALGFPGHLRIKLGETLLDEVNWGREVDDNGVTGQKKFPAPVAGSSMTLSANTAHHLANNQPWYWCNAAATPGAGNTETCGVAPNVNVDFCRTQSPGVAVMDTGAPPLVFSQFYEDSISNRYHDGNDGYPNVFAELGYGTTNTNVVASWSWTSAMFNPLYTEADAGENNDEVMAALGITAAGSYFYGFRYRFRDPGTGSFGSWVYCDSTDNGPIAEGSADTGTYFQVQVYGAAAQIAAARAAANGTGLNLPIEGALVTYKKVLDGTGFFIQATQPGPALFVEVAPGTLDPAVGDRVKFTITDMATSGMLRKATGITVPGDWKISGGINLGGLVQNVSSAGDLVSNVGGYESELIRIENATLSGPFVSAGTGFQAAQLDTAAITGNGNLRLRVPDGVLTTLDLTQGCKVTVNDTPLWRFDGTAQPSAWVAGDLTGIDCPAPQVTGATATDATTVKVNFDRLVKVASVQAGGSQFTIVDAALNPLAVSAAAASGKQVTLTTAAQAIGTSYTVTVASTVTDTYDKGIDAAHSTATFSGFQLLCAPQIVLSQVYGGGGNTGATFKNDFIELHNRSTIPVDVTGWSVQYASSTGSTWQVTPLGSRSIPAGGYLLIKEDSNADVGAELPAADVTGTIAMGGTSGKVALVRTVAALSGSCPKAEANVVDFVGYGSANCFEGTTGGTPSLSSTKAAIRNNNGCDDTNDNEVDFANPAPVPAPRNSATAVLTCGCD